MHWAGGFDVRRGFRPSAGAKKKSYFDKEFKQVSAWVRRTFPVDRGYRIESVKDLCDETGHLLDGELRYVPGGTAPYRILINRGLSTGQKIETLLHEVAHVLDVERHPNSTDRKDPHSGTWGEDYARVYRAYHKWRSDDS